MCKFLCKLCNQVFDSELSLKRHISIKYGKGDLVHSMPYYAYLAEYESKIEYSKSNLYKMYVQDKMSTLLISEHLSMNKITLLNLMKFYEIEFRNSSERSKVQNERNNGPWNKGKTKHNHRSIMSYANSRKGLNNPMHTAPGFEERMRKFRKAAKKGQEAFISSRNPKTTESRIDNILTLHKIGFVRNFAVHDDDGSWRLVDFLIEGCLAIELQGNYFHANPLQYGPEDTIKIAKQEKKAKDIWAYDERKRQLIVSKGYNYLAIWESEMKERTDRELYDSIMENL